jgi:CRISPR-associated endoribonuclease Cas6
MLLSILIPLTSLTSAPVFGALGRPVQAWFLNQVLQKNGRMAQSLHDDTGDKPYTVSTLLDRNGCPIKAGAWLEEGKEYWLRITTMGEEISESVIQHMHRSLPKSLSLYKMDFRIDGYTTDPHQHPWARQSSFADIAQDSQYVKAPREARMEFTSPTAFRSGGNDIPLPIPGQVFRSLGHRWNTFCPRSMKLDARWPDFANDCIVVNELTAVNTVHWEFAEGTHGAATGFTGTVGFALLQQSRVHEKWQPYWEGADAVIQSLAAFAFYSGVGHHTTVGMGQSRLLPGRGLSDRSPLRKTVKKS